MLFHSDAILGWRGNYVGLYLQAWASGPQTFPSRGAR